MRNPAQIGILENHRTAIFKMNFLYSNNGSAIASIDECNHVISHKIATAL